MKKAIKKITAIGTGAMLLGTSLLGATAALENFPAPFVTDGVADVQFVIGSGATDDYLGVLDIATTLQAAAVSEESVSTGGAGSEVTVTGGYDLSGSDEFYLNDTIAENLDDTELPSLLADGEIDYDGSDYEFSQSLDVESNAQIIWDEEDNEPVLKLDLETGDLWNYTFDMDDTFEATVNTTAGNYRYEETFTIEMLGKVFTVAEDQNTYVNNGKLLLYGSDVTTQLSLNNPVTIEVDGETYVVEITGANMDDQTATIDVNGDRKNVEEGDSKTIGGLDLFIDNLFVNDAPALAVEADVFVGSDEVILGDGKVDIDGEDVAGMASYVTFSPATVLDTISVTFDPDALNEDVSGYDEVEWLEAGDSVKDPLFGTFSVQFVGPTLELMDDNKAMFEITTPSDDVALFVETEEGTVTFDVYNLAGSNVEYVAKDSTDNDDGFVGPKQNDFVVDNVFILNEQDSEKVTKIYRVEDIDLEDGVKLYNMVTESTETVKNGKEIADTGVDVTISNDTNFNLSTTSSNVIYLAGGKQKLTLGGEAVNETTITFNEMEIASEIAGNESTIEFTVSKDGDDDEFDVDVTSSDFLQTASSKADDTNNHLTLAGSYIVIDTDESEEATGYAVMDEDTTVEYTVIIAQDGATVSTTGAGSVMTQMVNPIGLGVAVKDVDVNVANPAKNLIVVGGTCINSVAATLKGVAQGTCGTESGLNPDEAIIELFDLDNGKVAMLVAGWEATETQAAARAVASQDAALTGDSVTLTVTSATNYQIQ